MNTEREHIIPLNTQAPGGFDVKTYIDSVKTLFENQYQPDGETPDFRAIVFAEVHALENIDIDLPAILLDLQGAKLDPSQGEFEIKQTSRLSNLGELELYAYMRAVILTNNRDKTPEKDPQTHIRELAFNVGAFVSASTRFRHPAGLSQVTHIGPIDRTRADTTSLLGWEVRWQHSISLGEPDYTQLCDDPDIPAVDVQSVLVGFSPDDENEVETPDDETQPQTKQGYTEIYSETE